MTRKPRELLIPTTWSILAARIEDPQAGTTEKLAAAHALAREVLKAGER